MPSPPTSHCGPVVLWGSEPNVSVSPAQFWPEFEWVKADLSTPPTAETVTALSDVLAAVWIGSNVEQFQNHLDAWWQTHMGLVPPDILHSEQPDCSSVSNWLIKHLIADRGNMATLNASFFDQIGHLRQANLDQAEQLDALRQQFSDEPRRSLFSIDAMEDQLVLPSGSSLEQRLPGLAFGLGGLILNISAPAQGRLCAKLRLSELQSEVAQWSIENPGAGGLRLSLPERITNPRNSAVLTLEWHGKSALPLGGGATVDDPTHAAKIDGVAQPFPLAMRGRNHLLPRGAKPEAAQQKLPIAPDRLAQAVNPRPDLFTVQWLDLEQALLVHPLPHEVCAAYLPGIIPPRLSRVTIEIETRHMLASDLAYRIAAAPADARLGDEHIPDFEPEFATDWLSVSARRRDVLTLRLGASDTPLDLWLMTKVDKQGSTANGWACFSGLSLWG